MILVAASIATGNLAAQKPRITTVNEGETTFENRFSDRTTMNATPLYKKEQRNVPEQEVNYIKMIEMQPQFTTTGIRYNQKRDLQKKNSNPSLSVRKTSKEDVATVTLKVIGYPVNQMGQNLYFHLILDAEAEMYDYFFDYFFDDLPVIYDACEYKIPENASPDINNHNGLVDDEVSIDIPGGIYDFAIFNVSPAWNRVFLCVIEGDNNQQTLFDDFEFKTGYEYIFTAEYRNYITFNFEYDAALIDIIIPEISLYLTDQEDVSVVILNNGTQNIIDNVELSFRVNEGDWIMPETLFVSLEPSEEIIYTFNTKADFSVSGVYEVEAKLDYELDMWLRNNNIVGTTQKPVAFELPFFENFDTQESFEKWTVINANSWWDETTWKWDWLNSDVNGNLGGSAHCRYPLQIFPMFPDEPAEDYLISNAMNIPEAGKYHISFWAKPEGIEKLKILYGTNSNYNEMSVLTDFTIDEKGWNFYFTNFEIENPGGYYFTFYYYSFKTEGGAFINIDDVTIAEGEYSPVYDIVFTNAFIPLSSCGMTEEVIGVEIYNRGFHDVPEFTLTYRVNNGESISQTFTETIKKGEFVTVFTHAIDFSEVGMYNIIVTIFTPNDANTEYKELMFTIEHLSPVTEFPFVSDFSKIEDIYNWTPEKILGWGYNENFGCYAANPLMPNIPLLSRCIYLEPDTYRFSFNYSAGYLTLMNEFTDDFYISYGKSGTDPYEWAPVKEFIDYATGTGNFALIIEEEEFFIEINEAGDYVFAFVVTRLDGNIGIFDVTVDVYLENDFRFKNVANDFPRMTPVFQIEGEQTLTAIIENRGRNVNGSGTMKLSLNNSEVASENFVFSGLYDIIEIALNPVFGSLPTGPMNLKFTGEVPGGISKEWEITKIVSDSTYAWDNIDRDFYNGVGFNYVSAGFGLIFDIKKTDILTSIDVGFWSVDFIPENLYIILAVYEVSANFEIGDMLFEIKYPRIAESNMAATNYDVPDTELQPGKYYFEVRQLDNNNIAIANDFDENGSVWIYDPSEDQFEARSGFGYVHLRPNFGNPPVGIDKLQIANYELRIYPNPATSELRVESGELIMEKINVYNTAGQVVMSFSDINSTSYRINTEKLSAGLYFISVQTKDGVINGKFVVK